MKLDLKYKKLYMKLFNYNNWALNIFLKRICMNIYINGAINMLCIEQKLQWYFT